ncbi:MAG: PAS domain-containing protein [Paracoccaceae bacterium]|nr:PAS domain-containing protein [Paracoccaceae bacterium]
MTNREKQKRRAPLRRVESYWHALCGADEVPLRSQIDPRGLEGSLENAFLVERIAPSLAKLRVAGGHMSDLMGMEVAGMPLSTFIAPSDRDRLADAIKAFFADPAILKIELQAETGFNKPAMQAEMILLPLRSDMGEVSRGLGALVSTGRIGRTPRRFTITRIEMTPALKAPGVAYLPEPAPTVPLEAAEAPTPFRHKTPPAAEDQAAKGTPHLRLVVSND